MQQTKLLDGQLTNYNRMLSLISTIGKGCETNHFTQKSSFIPSLYIHWWGEKMKVDTRIEVKETQIYETETHSLRTTEETLNKITDGTNAREKMYEYISGKLNLIKGLKVDSGIQRDISRDAIYRNIMNNDEPPYKQGIEVRSQYTYVFKCRKCNKSRPDSS